MKLIKLQVIKKAGENTNVVAVARRFDIASNMVHRWIKEFEQGKFGAHEIDQIDAIEQKPLFSSNRLCHVKCYILIKDAPYKNGWKLKGSPYSLKPSILQTTSID